MTTVLEPGSSHADVVGGTLAFNLHTDHSFVSFALNNLLVLQKATTILNTEVLPNAFCDALINGQNGRARTRSHIYSLHIQFASGILVLATYTMLD